MPCTNCMTQYSKLRKEHGCSKCAFSFCEKCVKNKFVIPNLSPNPVSVCDRCYNILTGKKVDSFSGKDRHSSNTPSTSSKPKNWWGDDKLPPPSMRLQYTNEKKAALEKKANNVEDLERRLANIVNNDDDDGNYGNGGDTERLNPTGKKGKSGKDVTLAEIEERLAALRGVPVEVIRKPRLIVMDSDSMDENDSELTDEVAKLLKAAEAKCKLSSKHCGYDNPGLQLDDTSDSDCLKPSSSIANNSINSSDSSLVKKVIQEIENAPSESINDHDSSSQHLYPNFADCIRETIKEAKAAEKNAVEFIQSSQQQQQKQDAKEEPVYQKKTGEETNLHIDEKSHLSDKVSPKKKALSVFHRIFK